MTDFVNWLETELQKNKMDRAQLSKKANISESILSLIYSGARKPGSKTCSAIAKALHLPEEEVFEKAGIINATQNMSPIIKRIVNEVSQLKDEEQSHFYEFAKLWVKTIKKSR